MTGPMGRRVLKFDGAFDPEGCGGGSAADYKKGARLRRGLCRKFVKGKVDGPSSRRLWPPVGGGLCSLRSGGNGPSGRGWWIALWAMLIKSALRDWLSVSYGMIRTLVIGSLRSPPPIRLCHWTHLRCEGSEGSKSGGIALRAMSFIMPPSAVTSTSSIIIRITTVHPFATSWPSSPKGDARSVTGFTFSVI